MNKGELIALIAEQGDISKSSAEKSLNLVLDSILSGLKKGENINLVGFGSFNIQRREAREGRNPKTGEKMHINAYNQPMFRAGKGMKEACN